MLPRKALDLATQADAWVVAVSNATKHHRINDPVTDDLMPVLICDTADIISIIDAHIRTILKPEGPAYGIGDIRVACFHAKDTIGVMLDEGNYPDPAHQQLLWAALTTYKTIHEQVKESTAHRLLA